MGEKIERKRKGEHPIPPPENLARNHQEIKNIPPQKCAVTPQRKDPKFEPASAKNLQEKIPPVQPKNVY
jgi:hypothetical protein